MPHWNCSLKDIQSKAAYFRIYDSGEDTQ